MRRTIEIAGEKVTTGNIPVAIKRLEAIGYQSEREEDYRTAHEAWQVAEYLRRERL